MGTIIEYKVICLEWTCDGVSTYFIMVDKNTPKTKIESLIRKALRYGEDEVNKFVSLLDENKIANKRFDCEYYDFN